MNSSSFEIGTRSLESGVQKPSSRILLGDRAGVPDEDCGAVTKAGDGAKCGKDPAIIHLIHYPRR